ncbi:1-deoxy-D-xylulose-5-phosphate reductoisomerase [Fimbriimonas ginsengisoli]|uniref:1-deoxy-D-xylulose 5-phosphate reductoisomerase n=1 Tax=Fimbriimonas ginsengisoli Gsoil 348 TaxID=661478 RepID=A0A068NIM7_FIMGI|nr:1-deoxy-D-xylulose-5-phosphate reductoisomerase [Fimbriimonas ginsengisoli]AIE83458.1 1-deoxy-D-xylulose 5-phosphate reductoisomerase [Fimbriimonas ginsengisoli Gsoil 348]
MKRVVVLGSTGSIGTQTLDVLRQYTDRFQVVGLAARSNDELLRRQAAEHRVTETALVDRDGMDAVTRLATLAEADIVVVAVAGVIGLIPTIEAIKAGKQIALASKEVLVAAGEVVMPLVQRNGVVMTPIDSEHSALFQCLQGYRSDQIESLILTASGGPFRGRTRADLEQITVDQALDHPTWRMGGKITIDSATLMNKGLEMIEAKWLFGVEMNQVEVVVHPQSIIHSMVKFRDGSVLGQLGWPDMRLPIAYALLYPERLPNGMRPWNPVDTPNVTFERVDESTFQSLALAREAAAIGGTMPCAMNAANEEAANAFLRSEIRFLQIPEIVEKTMAAHITEPANLEAILAADESARRSSRSLMKALT